MRLGHWRAGRGHPRPRPGAPHPGKSQVTAPSSVSLLRSPESQVAGALGDTQTEPSLDQVLQERDEAIANRKRAVEAELDACRAKLRAVEAQLLEVVEEKLRLRQEVEAWEEDMQQLVRQQVQSQLQREAEDARGAQVDPGAARPLGARFSLGRWGRWW
ncbi:bicaudal D-related protein homolog [Choloepus didactylus]|uniref:bicaudal D-related protein homolog n=1 Tax=Choloepus didactylus TaxID=27675 RepID=UPI00189F5DAA|nr:bicaudal D-related protein homolog [Choloepus didactylus]